MLHVHLGQAFVFFAVGFALCFAFMLVNRILRPNRPTRDKLSIYECGEVPVGPGQFRLNIRFYTMALIFIIFDVELVAVLPTAVVFHNWVINGQGTMVFIEIFIFVSVLAVGLIYVWRKGDIDWIKDISQESTS